MSDTQLVRYDAMCQAIAVAYEVDEVKDLRDKALAIEMYARQAKNVEAERQACEIRLRAERRWGQLYSASAKAQGNRNDGEFGGRTPRQPNETKTLTDMGVSRDQSSRWQGLAEVDDETFEEAVTQPGASTTGILNAQKKHPVDPGLNTRLAVTRRIDEANIQYLGIVPIAVRRRRRSMHFAPIGSARTRRLIDRHRRRDIDECDLQMGGVAGIEHRVERVGVLWCRSTDDHLGRFNAVAHVLVDVPHSRDEELHRLGTMFAGELETALDVAGAAPCGVRSRLERREICLDRIWVHSHDLRIGRRGKSLPAF